MASQDLKKKEIVNKSFENARRTFYSPPLREAEVEEFNPGGASIDLRDGKIRIGENLLRILESLTEEGAQPQEKFEKSLEAVFSHEIGHYLFYPRNLSTAIILAKWAEDFCGEKELASFVLQTFMDMVVDTSLVYFKEAARRATLDFREAYLQNLDPLNSAVRKVMLGCLKYHADEKFDMEEELSPFLERMKKINFYLAETNLRDIEGEVLEATDDLDLSDVNKTRISLKVFADIIMDIMKMFSKQSSSFSGRYRGSRQGNGRTLKIPISDIDVEEALKKASPQELRKALREIADKLSKDEYEEIKKWLKEKGLLDKLKELAKKAPKTIGTSSGELPVDQEVLEYYKNLSEKYPLLITKKTVETNNHRNIWASVKNFRLGDDPLLVLPMSSGGKILPGITKSIEVKQKPIRKVDYAVPHLLVVIDSSGSMPDPKEEKSYPVIAAYCAARSYHIQGASIGVINFSSDSFYLPYTRELDDALAAISAYQGGGTVVNLRMVRKMLGKEAEKLFKKNPEANMKKLSRDFLKKDVSLPHLDVVFKEDSIDLLIFTDGGIANLGETLDFLEERSEVNRATLILGGHIFELVEDYSNYSKINVFKVESEEDIPEIVIRETARSLSSFAEQFGGDS